MKEKNAKNSGESYPKRSENANEGIVDINTDENLAGTSYLNDEMEEESDAEVVKLKEELQQQKDKYLRLVAEFDNFKKRTAKERVELSQMAGREIILSLLDVLDDAERAEKQVQSSEDVNQVREGVSLVFSKLRSILQGRGLRPMESIKTDFDVEKHDAISEIPAPSKDLEGKVVDEVQKGYYLNDKIIRHAKVVVGK
ncbi:MAG TPA: nucleotide exchange factor GrpE [Puia sp.]|nr:nucleotide exchange factor GrpE [Puia sp.]